MSFIVPEGKLYNLEMIKEISHGNNDFVKKMMALFNETMPAAIAELKQHLSASNWSDLGAVAHKIQPSIDTVGIELLKGLEWLHKKGFLFIDIKPQNFMLKGETVYFIDCKRIC